MASDISGDLNIGSSPIPPSLLGGMARFAGLVLDDAFDGNTMEGRPRAGHLTMLSEHAPTGGWQGRGPVLDRIHQVQARRSLEQEPGPKNGGLGECPDREKPSPTATLVVSSH